MRSAPRSRAHPRLLVLTAVLVAGLLFAAGCSDDDNGTVRPPDEFAPPTNVSAVNGDDEIVLTWTASPDETSDDFQQYNVYRGENSLLGVSGQDLRPFLIDSLTTSNDLPLTIATTNGTRYYFHVRAREDDGDLSGPSNEVQAAGREEGTGTIIWEFASDDDSGFDFSEGQTVSLSQGNPQRFENTDIYLGTTNELDDPSAPLALKGPQLLQNRDPQWGNRTTNLKSIDDWETSTTTNANWLTQIEVSQGTVLAVLTPDNHYAKIEVLNVETINEDRRITFRWAWQPTANLPLF